MKYVLVTKRWTCRSWCPWIKFRHDSELCFLDAFYTHTHMHTCMHTGIDAHTHTCIHACIQAYMHTYINTQTYTRTYIQTQAHRYIDAHTHTYMHTYISILVFSWNGTLRMPPCLGQASLYFLGMPFLYTF